MALIALLPEFERAIADLPQPEPWVLPIRPNTARLGIATKLIDDSSAGEALVSQLTRLQLGAIAIDTEFRFTSAPVNLGGGRSWQDPTTLQPLLLSGAAWIPDSDTLIRFVFDLRQRSLVPIVDRLLRLRTLFVAHYSNAEFKTLWALGLDPVFPAFYDTWVAARALTLGRGHRSIDLLTEARASEDMAAEAEAREMLDLGEGLLVALADRLSYALLLCDRAEIESLAGNTEAAGAAAIEQASRIAEELGCGPESQLRRRLTMLTTATVLP